MSLLHPYEYVAQPNWASYCPTLTFASYLTFNSILKFPECGFLG